MYVSLIHSPVRDSMWRLRCTRSASDASSLPRYVLRLTLLQSETGRDRESESERERERETGKKNKG